MLLVFLMILYNISKEPGRNLPSHFFPSPLYPGLHVHVYDPYVLLQNASSPHLPEALVHSSISDNKNANI